MVQENNVNLIILEHGYVFRVIDTYGARLILDDVMWLGSRGECVLVWIMDSFEGKYYIFIFIEIH